MNRITWEAAPNGGQQGFITGTAHGYNAKTVLFGIVFDPMPGTGGPWSLRHRLPFQPLDKNFPTAKVAQLHAERYLLLAMELIGFQPVPGPVKPVAIRHRKKIKGTDLRIGGDEPKQIVTRTRDFVVYRTTAADGSDLGEHVLSTAEFDKTFEVIA